MTGPLAAFPVALPRWMAEGPAPSLPLRLGGGASAATAIAALQFALGVELERYPYALYYPAVLAAAAVLGRGAALAATFASAVCVSFLLLEPRNSLAVDGTPDLLALTAFVFTAGLGGSLIELLVVAIRRLKSLQRALIDEADRLRDLNDELNHRMMNNFNILASLVLLEGRSHRDAAAQAFAALASRVRLFARLHAHLQPGRRGHRVELRPFLDDLCRDLGETVLAAHPVSLGCEMEPIALSDRQATAIGLIVNEAVTNAAKHAFPHRRPGTIAVRLARPAPGRLRLEVADDGVGRGAAAADGGGSGLLRRLAAQLGGSVSIDADGGGSTVTVDLPEADPMADPRY
ncbi:MAG TPA: sensor histidine kinase [Alphaproteobacteria bacterium]|nr:sensor histidine kinase [Alphaproteobacteria bacterium]